MQQSSRMLPYRKRVPEFQAVILAGYGNRLYPLTEDSNVPKALLPIANKPMISYSLAWLEASGVTDVIIISVNSGSKKINQYAKGYEGELHIDVVTVDDNTGSAQALATIKDKIKSDFIVVSCDLTTALVPHMFLDLHRSEDPTVTALFFTPTKTEGGASGSSKPIESTQYVGVDASNSRLVYVNNSEQLDSDDFTLRTSLLDRHPVMNISRLLQDGHLYVFKKWVMDVIVTVAEKRTDASIRDHVLPLLVKSQYQKVLAEKEGVLGAYENSLTVQNRQVENTTQLAMELSTTQAPAMVTKEWVSPVVCRAFVLPSTVYCGRANSIATYFELNRYYTKLADKTMTVNTSGSNLSKQLQSLPLGQSPTSAASTPTMGAPISGQGSTSSQPGSAVGMGPGGLQQVLPQAQQIQVGADSLIGSNCRVGERSSIKKSTIGSHVTIGKNVKIINSIIMDYAVIEDSVKLEGCIVCMSVRIGEKASLQNCEVGGGFTVEKDTRAKNEQLVDFQEE